MDRTNNAPAIEETEHSRLETMFGSAMVALGMLCYAAITSLFMYSQSCEQKRKTINAVETAGTINFQTPHGSIKYAIAPEARKEWQRLLFFEEARQCRDVYAIDVFELCKRIDKVREEGENGERILSLEEITKARYEAERNY